MRKRKYLIDNAKMVILLEGRKPTCEIIEESVLSAKDVRRLYDGGFWKRFSHFLLSSSLDSQTQQSSAVSERNFHRQNTLPPSEHPSTVRTPFHCQNTRVLPGQTFLQVRGIVTLSYSHTPPPQPPAVPSKSPTSHPSLELWPHEGRPPAPSPDSRCLPRPSPSLPLTLHAGAAGSEPTPGVL